MKNEFQIEVYAGWLEKDNQIGTLFSSSSRNKNVYSFEFTDSWLYNFSHIMLDPELYSTRGRQFVPNGKVIWGFLSDSLPDRWGRTLLKKKEEILAKEEGRAIRQLTELDFLTGINDETRMGGLRFKFSGKPEFITCPDLYNVPPMESLRKLEQASINFEKSEFQSDIWLRKLLQPGSSLGGARPKATVKDENGQLWIAKFPAYKDDYNVGVWEKITSDLARLSGLNMPETAKRDFSDNGSTFLARRFDRSYDGNVTHRIHYASALSLLGKTDGSGYEDGSSYLNMADFIKSYSIQPRQDLEELWNRIVFSILVSNTDDHLRNHDFLLTENGWKLAPLFDVNPNPLGNMLTLNITENNNQKKLCLALDTAKYYGLTLEKAKANIQRIVTAISDNWERLARQNKCSQTEIDVMRNAFEDSSIFEKQEKYFPQKRKGMKTKSEDYEIGY